MARTPKEIVRNAAELRRTFGKKLRELDARRAEIVAGAVRAAETKRIVEIRERYV